MTPEEREKAIQVMVDRYISRVTVSYGRTGWEEGVEYATTHYNLYSDEALLSLIINHTTKERLNPLDK